MIGSAVSFGLLALLPVNFAYPLFAAICSGWGSRWAPSPRPTAPG